MRGRVIFPSPRLRGEGGAASAAGGEGAVQCRTSASPSPLPLKGARAFGVASECHQDYAQDAVEVGHHVRVGEPDHAVAALFQGSCARGVVTFAAAVSISAAFDHEALGTRGEVGDVGRGDGLPLELHAEAVRSEVVPEPAFGLGEVLAQRFGASSCFDVPFQTARSPRSASQSRPLLLKGARGVVRHALNSIHGSSAVNA
jgi:hypothetical protein